MLSTEMVIDKILELTESSKIRDGKKYVIIANERSMKVQWNLDLTNLTKCPGQSYSKMYGKEPRYNEPSI